MAFDSLTKSSIIVLYLSKLTLDPRCFGLMRTVLDKSRADLVRYPNFFLNLVLVSGLMSDGYFSPCLRF